MGLFARFGLYARGLVYLRDISRSLRTLADNDTERMRREFGPRTKGRPVSIETLDLAAAERKWERQVAARGQGIEWEDES